MFHVFSYLWRPIGLLLRDDFMDFWGGACAAASASLENLDDRGVDLNQALSPSIEAAWNACRSLLARAMAARDRRRWRLLLWLHRLLLLSFLEQIFHEGPLDAKLLVPG